MEENSFEWLGDIEPSKIGNRLSSNGIKYEPKLTDEIFNEIKEQCIKVWNTYDNTHGYVDEKVNEIIDLPNSWVNAIRMLRMFHVSLSKHVYNELSSKTKDRVILELLDRGYNVNLYDE